MRRGKLLLLLLVLSFASQSLLADQPSTSQLEFFEKRIRPLLADHCFECHSVSAKSPKAGLLLDSQRRMLAGGDSGPAIVAGNPDDSLLIHAVEYGELRMPPRSKLADKQVEALRQWIQDGAVWPDEPEPEADGKAEEFNWRRRAANHWCWQPLDVKRPPQVNDSNWVRNPLDQFVLHKLEAVGLSPSEDADRFALIRRLSFDLIGLPPSDEEVLDFVNDDAPDAVERLVDRLLSSPHFGEKWARHWMDLVRYAETCGHEFDYALPHAWKYRDYLIRAFNQDVPYDQFVTEHIAGDLLPQPRRHLETQTNESVLGTGFWFLGEAVHGPTDVRGDEADRIDNSIDVFGKTFLGLTIACARCHDHKFDPISATDYYALAGFLQSSRRQEALLDPNANIASRTKEIAALRAKGQSQFDQLATDSISGQQFAQLLMRDDARVIPPPQSKDGRNPWTPLQVWFDLKDVEPDQFLDAVAELQEECASEQQAWNEFVANSETLYDLRNSTDGWFHSGSGVDSVTTAANEWDVSSRPVAIEREGTVSSGLLGRNQQGVLRSPTFTVKKPNLHYLMRGEKVQIRLIIDGFVMDTYNPLLFQDATLEEVNTEGAWQWQTQFRDLHLHLGHRAHIELIDHGEGSFAVQEIRTSDKTQVPSRPNGISAAILQQTPSTREELAKALGAAWDVARDNLINGTLNDDQVGWVNWMLQREIITVSEGSELHAICQEVHRLDDEMPSPDKALAMIDGSPEDEFVHIRGSHKNLGNVVPRRFLLAISGEEQPSLGPNSGRLALARRVTEDGRHLTARVLVNRLWHHLMGRGIVFSVDDFGAMGQPPSHPELLDWMAQDFVDGGWSIKRAIRQIVLSSTYRQSSAPSADVDLIQRLDPKNELYHKAAVRRITAESIRDASLCVTGRLDRKMFGPSVPVHLTSFMQGRGRPAKSGPLDGNGRRSVYLEVRRNFLSPMMLTFDMPIPFSSMGRRSVSNVPAQALIMMNHPLIHQQSKRLGEQWHRDHHGSIDNGLDSMFFRVVGRPPTPTEREPLKQYLLELGVEEGGETARDAWISTAHALFNTKMFIYLR